MESLVFNLLSQKNKRITLRGIGKPTSDELSGTFLVVSLER
jgi:hypothetical protein